MVCQELSLLHISDNNNNNNNNNNYTTTTAKDTKISQQFNI